jgi:hypothetical protein
MNTKTSWCNVDDEQPDDNREVITLTEYDGVFVPEISMYNDEDKTWEDAESLEEVDVKPTYWMDFLEFPVTLKNGDNVDGE